jgi:signal transduction histidine kinase
MQVRWRQYEMIFCVTVALVLGVNELTGLITHRGAANDTPVAEHLLPFLLTYGVPVLLMVIINLWLLPRYLHTRFQLLAFSIAGVACWNILTVAFTISYNLKFDYLLQKMGEAEFHREGMEQGIQLSITLTAIYLLYLRMREPLITWINKERENKPLYVMVCNHITATAFVYVGLMIMLGSFGMFRSDASAILYVFIVLPVIIIIFINVYVLFPQRHRKKTANLPFFYKLLVAPFILALVCWVTGAIVTDETHFWILPVLWLIFMVIATPLSYLFFVQQKDKLIEWQQLKKDLGKTTADLAFLRSQINPHFLFNTLNTLYGTALQENASRTATGVQRLGDMMRFLLHDNHRDEIPLSRELEYLQNYIALQQLRIVQSAGINIETAIHDCANERMIAPMLLIPFVENAFKHGIRLTTPSYIRIRFYCDDKGVYLDVVNSAHSPASGEVMPAHSGVGLQNVKQRLELIYPGKHTLLIHQDDAAFEVHLFIEII